MAMGRLHSKERVRARSVLSKQKVSASTTMIQRAVGKLMLAMCAAHSMLASLMKRYRDAGFEAPRFSRACTPRKLAANGPFGASGTYTNFLPLSHVRFQTSRWRPCEGPYRAYTMCAKRSEAVGVCASQFTHVVCAIACAHLAFL